MNKRLIKNSKKGFSLPAAMAITAVLIILSASLIIIASNSISTTSSSVNSRQAYLNVKSALEYAETYYTNRSNMTSLMASGTENYEYMIMKDTFGGTVSEGANISSDENDTKDKMTYVVAKYTPSTGNEKPKLKLTAYANYTDAFGKKGATSKLSITFDASGGNVGRRITDPTIPPSVGTKNYSDTITINVKKRPDQTWGSIAYYIWTFEDKANAYENATPEKSFEKINLSDANKNEYDDNMFRPAGQWVGKGSADKLGPPALVSESGGGMLSSTFSPRSKDVNYFNIIFANKGAVLNNDDGSRNDDAQTCEMFHLWYLDPSDKNVYFEFLSNQPYYYAGTSWNGTDNLEDDMLVYVKNPKTTVHFKIKGVDDTALTPSISAPVINKVTVAGTELSGKSYLGNASKAVNNLEMTYEGCGWWTANIETGDTFKMTMSYAGMSGKTVTVTPNSNNEAWVYANTITGTIQSRLSESSANTALGVSSDSYVTIHAQSYDNKNKVSPTLNYKDVQINSSAGRIDLYDKILEAQQYSADNYTDESYNAMKTVLDEAIVMYNDIDFIKNQSGATTAEKIENADKKYREKAKELDDKINALVGKGCDAETLQKLKNLVEQGDAIVSEQAASGKYDSGAYGVFTAAGGAYQKAKDMLNDANLTKVDAENQITALQTAIDTIKATVLDKTNLEALINSAKTLAVNTKYEQSYREALNEEITKAEAVYNNTSTTQADVDTATNNLQAKMDDVIAHPVTTFNTAELTKAISVAGTLLNTDPKLNCTDETYNMLQTVYDAAGTILTSAKSQTEIDDVADKLEQSISDFMVVKPEATDDQLNNEHKIRLWLNVSADISSYTLNLVKKADENADDIITTDKLVKDVASGLSYYDVDKEIYSKVYFSVNLKNKSGDSEKIALDSEDVQDNNMVINVSATKKGSTVTVTTALQKLTTLYIEKKTLDSEPRVEVSMNGVEGMTPDIIKTTASADGKYYVARLIYGEDNKVVINSKLDGSGTSATTFTSSAGQFVVRYISDTVVELINVKNIYPKYETTSGSSTGYTILNATIDAENLISPTILANVTDSYAIALTKANTQKVEEREMELSVPSGKSLIVINTTGVDDLNGKTPYGYFWNSKGDIGAVWPGSPLLRYEDTEYYYALVDNSVKGLIVTANGNNKIGGDIMFTNNHVRDKSTDTVKPYIVIDSSNGNNFNGATAPNTRPTVKAVVTMYDAGDMTGSDLPMAFVGGNKVRATNKSYVETYGEYQKYNQNHSVQLNNSNKFGGSGGNGESMNRVGDTQLSPYYDWYEYKIPVDQLANFTFEVKGLASKTDNTYTEQISSVHGDIWITLNSTHKDSGRYDDISIYTFDPEENQMEYVYDTSSNQTIEKTRIYFNMPNGWTNAKVTVAGIGTEETLEFTKIMDSYSANPAAANYYYVDVSIDKPFLTFRATDGDSKTHIYKTSLQGGDTVLFDPDLQGGNGGWDDYVSPQTLLKREVLKAQTVYYGSVIVGKYDNDGYVADYGEKTYNYAENLKGIFKPYTRHDASYKADLTISLQKVYGCSNEDAYSGYSSLNQWVTAYQNLYSAMSSAKAYIANPITGGVHPGSSSGVYPEYKNRSNNQEYEDASIDNLKEKLQSAETIYLSDSVAVTAINKSAKNLKAAISNIKVKSEGSITVIFYDSQGKAQDGAKIQVKYKSASHPSGTIVDVTSRNPEGFPIIKISDDGITDVDFVVNGVERNTPKDKMEKDSTWVFMDQASNAYWAENTTCDYVLFTTDSFEQSNATDKYTVEMKKEKDASGNPLSTYRDMVLYFNYDTEVTRAGGDSFTVKAGAYVFNDDDTKKSNSPVNGGTFDLYSDKSKDYFTNPVNYGAISGAKDAKDIGWVDSNGVLSGAIKTYAYSVNITIQNTTIKTIRKYKSLDSMYFRYSDNDSNFVINSRLELTAKEFVMASSSAFDGTGSTSAHFYLYNTDASADKLKITFKSDINVKYRDNTGEDHSFIIREGSYELSKQTDTNGNPTTSYFADIFDEAYWKSPNVVCITNGSATSSAAGQGILSNPVYSND